ncbi:MAG: NADAR family protein [Alphaproteobacteria bacterium]|nr:NADAR family protein [Alphaproteobacteria bacterium]
MWPFDLFKQTKIIPTFTTPDARFLSNFYPFKKNGQYPHKLKIYYYGVLFSCTETAYQAAKTMDMELRYKISQMNPFEAVALSKSGGIPTRKDWDAVKYSVMEDLVWQKFQHPELKKMLLKTKNAILQEGNTWGDVYWGICNGVGENNLGKILMATRDKLRR